MKLNATDRVTAVPTGQSDACVNQQKSKTTFETESENASHQMPDKKYQATIPA
jgi:hypothetical protein